MHMKGGTNYIHGSSFGDFFYNNARGPSRDNSCKMCAIEYRLGRHQLMHLTLHLGLTHTRGGLKGWGVVGRSFWAHSLWYALGVGWHFVATALTVCGA